MSIPVLTLALAEHVMQFDEVDDPFPVMSHFLIEASRAGRHVFRCLAAFSQGARRMFRPSLMRMLQVVQ